MSEKNNEAIMFPMRECDTSSCRIHAKLNSAESSLQDQIVDLNRAQMVIGKTQKTILKTQHEIITNLNDVKSDISKKASCEELSSAKDMIISELFSMKDYVSKEAIESRISNNRVMKVIIGLLTTIMMFLLGIFFNKIIGI